VAGANDDDVVILIAHLLGRDCCCFPCWANFGVRTCLRWTPGCGYLRG
jgi:hypothetical protein